MDNNTPPSFALALEPVATPAPEESVSPQVAEQPADNAQAKRDLRMTSTDEFLAAAAKEYEEGQIDAALWRRAEQGGADPALVVAVYLRARATALQLHRKEEQRAQARTHGATSTQGTSGPRPKAESRREITSEETEDVPQRRARPKAMIMAAAGVALASVVAVVCVLALPRKSESAQAPIAAVVALPASHEAPPAVPTNEQLVAKATGSGASVEIVEPSIESRALELKKAGNWNVFALYASEWTRKEPNNPTAWNELSIGYMRLRQFGDALDAANKAVQLSPGDAQLWRNLGDINLTVNRLPDAGVAFDKALAANPNDADALCGAAQVAQRLGRPKDADAMLLRAKAVDRACAAPSDGGSAVVIAGAPAARQPAPALKR